MIGVVIPARDEARTIGRCLASVRNAAACIDESVLLVVVADVCTDDTIAIASEFADRVLTRDAGCVGAARHAGCALALSHGCRWLANTDADCRVPLHWLAHQMITGADVVCGTVSLGFSRWISAELRARYVAAYLPCEGHPHVHGANLGVSAKAYTALGGFASLSSHEDVELVARAEREGWNVLRSARSPVVTSARLHSRAPDGFGAYLQRLGASASRIDVEACPDAAT